MWLVLTFVACLSVQSGDRCRNVELAWEGTPHQCMLFGQQQIAQWMNENPGYRLRRGYRCTNGRPV